MQLSILLICVAVNDRYLALILAKRVRICSVMCRIFSTVQNVCLGIRHSVHMLFSKQLNVGYSTIMLAGLNDPGNYCSEILRLLQSCCQDRPLPWILSNQILNLCSTRPDSVLNLETCMITHAISFSGRLYSSRAHVKGLCFVLCLVSAT